MENESIMKQVEKLSKNLSACVEMLSAIGDETRQHLVLEIIKLGKCEGVRVGRITETTDLSRSTISHHLKILKDAGLIKVRHDGTMNFYYFAPEAGMFDHLTEALQASIEIAKALPEKTEENE